MKSQSIQQFAIVKEDSASAFEGTLNARIRELSAFYPTVTFSESDPFFARISYKETVMIPETIVDRYELGGTRFHCEDCPSFQPILKADGTEDGRVKYGDCEFSRQGRTYKDSDCCEQFYTMLENGRIGLCWKR